MRLVRGFAAALVALALPLSSHAQQAVTGYHGGGARSGQYVVPGLTWTRAATVHADPAFDGRVAGHVYAQPLYWRAPGADHGILLVATEANILTALDSRSGAELWHRNFGPRVPLAALPCGDVDPIGITGTPVIDPATGTLYVVALTADQGPPRHVAHAVSLADGAERPGWPVSIPAVLHAAGEAFDSRIENQRSALALFRGRVYVAFGGNSGDCRAYHGWIVALDAGSGALAGSWSTRAQKGGIWAQGGIADDGTALFASTGNTYGATSYGDGEGVFRLAADLKRTGSPHDFFAPRDWRYLDQTDADLGSTGPIPLDLPAPGGPRPVVLQLGKDGNGYVLDRNDLGGISDAPAMRSLYNGRITTGPATFPLGGGVGVAMYGVGVAKACPNKVRDANVLAVRVAAGQPPTLTPLWCAAVNGRGAPIVTTSDGHSDAIVWMLGAEGDDLLHAFRAATGEPLAFATPASLRVPRARHFATLIAAEGRLYVAGDGRLHAFAFGP